MRRKSLHGLVPLTYVKPANQTTIARWSVLQDGSRHYWPQTELILPGTSADTHTLEGHDAYITALIRQGAAMRDFVAETLRYQIVTKAMAGRTASDAMRAWLDLTWDVLIDLIGHRQRMRHFNEPEKVPQWIWNDHTEVWLLFRWELLKPLDDAVAAFIAGHFKLFAFPGFEWMTPSESQTLYQRVMNRRRAPLSKPKETVIVDLGGDLRTISKGPNPRPKETVTLAKDHLLLAAGNQPAGVNPEVLRFSQQPVRLDETEMALQAAALLLSDAGGQGDSSIPSSAEALHRQQQEQQKPPQQLPPPPPQQQLQQWVQQQVPEQGIPDWPRSPSWTGWTRPDWGQAGGMYSNPLPAPPPTLASGPHQPHPVLLEQREATYVEPYQPLAAPAPSSTQHLGARQKDRSRHRAGGQDRRRRMDGIQDSDAMQALHTSPKVIPKKKSSLTARMSFTSFGKKKEEEPEPEEPRLVIDEGAVGKND